MASRRACMTWQARNSGHSLPRQLSRVEVTSGITGERSSRPSISARSPLRVACAHCATRCSARTAKRSGSCAAALGLVQPVAAQVAGAALEQRHAHRHAQRVAQARQVAQEELVLQALGGGADQRTPARQQQRHQVGEGLADAGAGLGHQRLAAGPRPARCERPACPAPRAAGSAGRCAASGPSAAKGAGDRRGAGSPLTPARAGRAAVSRLAIWSRSSRRRFFSRRSDRSSAGTVEHVAVDQVVEIGVFHAQLDQPALRRMQVLVHCCTVAGLGASLYSPPCPHAAQSYRISAATGLHRGDRAYQQDQVEIITHPRVNGCRAGGGGRRHGRQERRAQGRRPGAADRPPDLRALRAGPATTPPRLLRQLVLESHLMIKLTAITAEEEPHSTVAAFCIGPGLRVRRGACRRFARLPLPRRRDDAAHHGPLLRAAPDRRRQDHRGSGQHATRSPTC